LDDEDDEDEPEWVDFDPKTDAIEDKKDFFGRAIPDEKEVREEFDAKRDRY